MIEELRQKARELLEKGEVDLVIGYGEGSDPTRTMPVFIRRPEDCDRLVWNKYCYNNLTSYLTWPELKTAGKRAVVCKGCDAKAVVVLCKESQINREDVVVIGMSCEGVGEPLLGKCEFCDVRTPKNCDIVIGPEIEPLSKEKQYEDVEQLEGKDAADRWEFWRDQFSRCIKCYACRQACPLCYCTQCIVERNQPQWVPTSSHAPCGPVYRLRRVRTRLPEQHPAHAGEQKAGAGCQGTVRVRVGLRYRRAAADGQLHARGQRRAFQVGTRTDGGIQT